MYAKLSMNNLVAEPATLFIVIELSVFKNESPDINLLAPFVEGIKRKLNVLPSDDPQFMIPPLNVESPLSVHWDVVALPLSLNALNE